MPRRRPARLPRRPSRRGLRRRGPLGAVLALLVLAGAGVVVWQAVQAVQQRVVVRERCVARSDAGRVGLDLEQAEHAATIAGVGRRLGVGERGIAIALATAMQESKLHNVSYGDRDSLGLFQQRPSQGWGRRAQVLDPVYAATRFFRALQEVPSYERLALTDAAQRVQRSAYGDLYAQHEPDARILASVLSGEVPGGLSCALRAEDVPMQQASRSGLIPRAERVRTQLERVFGPQELASGAGSGFTVRVPAASAGQPAGAAGRQAGWAQASWLVASADRLEIATVTYDGRVWSAAGSARGWRAAPGPRGPGAGAGAGDPAGRIEVEVLPG